MNVGKKGGQHVQSWRVSWECILNPPFNFASFGHHLHILCVESAKDETALKWEQAHLLSWVILPPGKWNNFSIKPSSKPSLCSQLYIWFIHSGIPIMEGTMNKLPSLPTGFYPSLHSSCSLCLISVPRDAFSLCFSSRPCMCSLCSSLSFLVGLVLLPFSCPFTVVLPHPSALTLSCLIPWLFLLLFCPLKVLVLYLAFAE